MIGDPLVRYRVHDQNHFHGKKQTPDQLFLRRLEGRRLTEYLRQRLSLPHSLIELAHYEFRTIENPSRSDFNAYRSLVRNATIPMLTKVKLLTALSLHYHFGVKV